MASASERDAVSFRAVVRYAGGAFSGWQVQPGERTVQGALEAALSRIAGVPVTVAGASRTDAGVHAFGQVCSFLWPGRQSAAELQHALSRMLAPSIRIEALDIAPPGFHARYSAHSKRYAYTLALTRHVDPFVAAYAWHVPWPVDTALLARLAVRLEGEHDFAGFQSSGASVATTVRCLYRLAVQEGGVIGPRDGHDLWHLEFHGNGFLYKMVRNITGTLVDIARGHLPEETLEGRLAAPGPYRGFTAPAQGLTLLDVLY